MVACGQVYSRNPLIRRSTIQNHNMLSEQNRNESGHEYNWGWSNEQADLYKPLSLNGGGWNSACSSERQSLSMFKAKKSSCSRTAYG